MEISNELLEKYQEPEKQRGEIQYDEKYYGRFSVSLPNPILFDQRVSSTGVRVYGLLQMFAMLKGECYPSHRRLSEFLKRSPRSVITSLKNLEAAGWIKIKRLGQRKANLYILSWPDDCYSPDKAVANKQYRKDKQANAWKVRT